VNIKQPSKEFPFPIHYHYKNIKHTYFKFDKQGVIVHTSPNTPKQLVETYIANHLDKFTKKYQSVTRQSYVLWGKEVDIQTHSGDFSYKVLDDTLFITYEKMSFDDAFKRVLYVELEKFVKQIEPEMNQRLLQFNIKPRTINYKWFTSKFGSYHKGHDTISLNTYLSTLEESLTVYVLYHEYAHTVHFHHQKSFYNLLESLLPEHKAFEKKLKSLVISKHYTV
jgi:predicted metal-dependent hydrolase